MTKWNSVFEISAGLEGLERMPNKLVESSSTIKLPIMLLVLEKIDSGKLHYWSRFKIYQRHFSSGSGILNWMNKKSISVFEALRLIAKYSDCVATNVLIDYLGGAKQINKQMADRGYKTRLHMDVLDFEEDDESMPHIGTTSAHEMMELMQDVFERTKRRDKLAVRLIFRNIDTSWFELGLGKDIPSLYHKTGSMIAVGPTKDTVFNVVGVVDGSPRVYFAYLSRGHLTETTTANEQKSELANELWSLIERL